MLLPILQILHLALLVLNLKASTRSDGRASLVFGPCADGEIPGTASLRMDLNAFKSHISCIAY